MLKYQSSLKLLILIMFIFASNSILANHLQFNDSFQTFVQNYLFPNRTINSPRNSVDLVGEINYFSRVNYDNPEGQFNNTSRTINTYNEDGQISESATYINYQQYEGLVLAARSYYYYENNLLDYVLYESYSNPSSIITQRYEYYYDENNYIDNIRIFMSNTLYSIMDYTYSNDGLLMRVDYFDDNYNYDLSSTTNYITYQYNDTHQITLQNIYKYHPNSNDQLTGQSEYCYDEQGRKTSYISHWITTNLYLIEDYLYDNNDYLIRIDKSQINNNIEEDSGYTLITNDTSGNAIRDENYNMSDEITDYITRDYITIVSNSNSEIAKADNLSNHPNPFNPETTISFTLTKAGHVSLTIYNILGQKVTDLINDFREAGNHHIVWEGKDDNGQELASGLYLYRIQVGRNISTKKMILMK